MFAQQFKECIPQFQSLLSALSREDHEWVLASRKEVLYTSPGVESETGITLGMSIDDQPWFQEIFKTKKKLLIRKKGWRTDSERLSQVIGVPLLDSSGEVQGAFLYIMEFYNKIRAKDILSLVQDLTREEDLMTALNIFTQQSLNLFRVSMVGIWLWQEGKYGLASISTLLEEQLTYIESEEFPKDFGLSWIQECQIYGTTDPLPRRYNLDELNEPCVHTLKEFGLKTLVCMPLIHFGQTLGQIILFARELDDIEDETVYWIRQAVPFVSSFVYEQQLRFASIDREQALTFLLRGTEILVQADTEEQLLTEAGEMAMEILYLPCGFFFLKDGGEWHIRAPFGRLKQTDWDWKKWIDQQITKNGYAHISDLNPNLRFIDVEENPDQWRKILIQPIQTHTGVIGELWLMDELEWVAEQRQEILAAYVRDVGVALETIRQRDELAHLASTDRLTGILNRQGFDQRIREEMAGTIRRNSTFLLLILDLDFFKTLNDTKGHPTGDLALMTIAQNLRASVREEDIVARTGGDEFTVVLTDAHRSPEIQHAIERMKAKLELEKFGLDVSIGVAEFPTEGRDYEELYRLADQRLYVGKKNGKGQTIFA